MKIRLGLVLTAVVALAIAAVAYAAPSAYKITGGGQILASSSSNGGGPGDTITFQAFTPDQGAQDATGHVNIIDRSGTGKGVHYRGEVECVFLASDPEMGMGYAELQGTGKDQQGNETAFRVRIDDNGQGAGNTDMVEFDRDAPQPDCSDNENGENFTLFLARGNAKIHKENQGASNSNAGARSTSAKSLSLSALR